MTKLTFKQFLLVLITGIIFLLLIPRNTYAIDQYTQGKTEFLPQENGTYNVTFSWNEVNSYGISGYSLAISDYAGADPGPLVDTTATSWTFSNINTGTHYINIKDRSIYGWSRIWYWKIDVPAWVAPTISTINPTDVTNNQASSTTTTDSSNKNQIYLLISVVLGIFLIFSLSLISEYKEARKIIYTLNEIKEKAQSIDNEYIYVILPPVKPLIEKPRKINYNARRYYYRRRYY